MKHVARNLSLVTNVLLLLVVALCLGSVWRLQQTRSPEGESGTDYRRMSRIYETFILDKLAAISLIGTQLPKVTAQSLAGEVISTDLSAKKAALVLLFKPQACQPCLITQLKALQLIQETITDTADIAVYAFAKSPVKALKRFTRAFGLTYPVISDTAGQVMTETLAASTPVVILVNERNTIIDAHIPTPGRPEFSLLFYNELRIQQRTGARLDWERFDFGLEGQPKIDVIMNRFNASHPNVVSLLQ